MDTQNSSPESCLELYFLIAKFLKDGPCQRAFKALEEELVEKRLLPVRYDIEGEQSQQTLEELSDRYPHVTPDTLLKVCERLRDVQNKEFHAGSPVVSSLLASGRYSLLRRHNKPLRLHPFRIYARRRGCMLMPPARHAVTNNIVRLLESRRTSGPLHRKDIIWPKLYNRLQLLNQTLGHITSVYCVLFDKTGRFIFTGADDLLVKVWSTISGRLMATFRGASSEITDLAVNVENTLLAAGSLDRVLYVWCLQTTSLVAQLSASVSMITGVNFCPTICGDYRYLASTSTDGSVAFWIYTHKPLGKDTIFLGHPVLFHEKMRPGVAQMICSAFSPGGSFLAAGSADHHVRVYLMPGDGGPQRIMEEEAHQDRVDSIQWANHGLRFVSGSKDGTALVWRFHRQKWVNLRLDVTADLPGRVPTEELQRQKPRVSMVCWDRTDRFIITAVHDSSLKVWNSETGALINVLQNHHMDVFVLEPHPLDDGIMLSAGHDGLLCIWDIRTGNCLLQYRNFIEGQGQGCFFDAKWSPDGTMVAATDSHGHIMLFGFGAATQVLKDTPKQLFFNTDYWPLRRDETGVILDQNTGEAPHLMTAPYLVNVEGVAYPPNIQRMVPGREFDDHIQATVNTAPPTLNGDSVPSRATPNAWLTRPLLPMLPSSVLRRIRDEFDYKAEEEHKEYEREKRLPAESPQRPAPTTKAKPRKKRTTNRSKAAAAADEDPADFVNPETLEISQSSDSSTESSSLSGLDSDSSGSSRYSEYSDWVAESGVALEPPTRSRRKRPPAKLSSPSPTPRQQRTEKKVNNVNDGESDDSEHMPIKELPEEFLPPKWLSDVIPRKAPYYPQMGDLVMFFQRGYKLYLDAVRKKQVYKLSTKDTLTSLQDPISAQVIGIRYEIRPPRLCCLRLAIVGKTNQFIHIKYHDMPDVIDFLVLKQTYDIAMSRNWKPGDRFRCVIDDAWWLGNIVETRTDEEHPNSPFLSLLTKWDNGEDEPMSPWDLEPVDPARLPQVPGESIEVLAEENLTLLYSPIPDEWPDGNRDGTCDRISKGVDAVMSFAMAEAFSTPVDLNSYPTYAMEVEYPVDLSTIKARLDNRFYRRLTAVQFDVRYLATNAEKFNAPHSQIVKHARIITDLCLRIIKQDADLDVTTVYRHLVNSYQSSSDEENGGGGAEGRSVNTLCENWIGDCERLLREITALPDSTPFREPVDLHEFPDYLQVVSTPMDIGTVREELMAGNYRSPKDFQEDVRLIFANSKKYNTNKRSRIFAMSQRLSNLFEARMKQLQCEWKSSKRKKEPSARRPNQQPNSPQPGPSHRFEAFDALKSSDDEPQPSTSGMNSNRVRPISDSDDDTNLSTLRNNLVQSDEETLKNGTRTTVNKFKEQNGGVDDTTDGETSKELNTLKNGQSNGIEVNGHSYTKPAKLVNGNGKVDSSVEESSEEDEYKPVKHDDEGSTSPEEDSKASSTDWTENESSASSSGSAGPSLSKGRRVCVRYVKKSRRRNQQSSDSDNDNLPLAASRTVDESDNDEESSDDSEPPVRKSQRRNKGRRRNDSSEDSPPRRRKRRRRGSSGSVSSGWRPSDNENGRSKRVLRTRGKRTGCSEESDDDSPAQTVSSRGRVRKLTERAREAMKRKS